MSQPRDFNLNHPEIDYSINRAISSYFHFSNSNHKVTSVIQNVLISD